MAVAVWGGLKAELTRIQVSTEGVRVCIRVVVCISRFLEQFVKSDERERTSAVSEALEKKVVRFVWLCCGDIKVDSWSVHKVSMDVLGSMFKKTTGPGHQ